jgi:prolyl oligopeptidase
VRELAAIFVALLLVNCSNEPDAPTTPEDTQIATNTPTNTPVEDSVEDPYLWLEEVEGERALDWVRGQNTRSLDQLTSDPIYQTNLDQALEVLTSEDRIAYGSVRDGHVYNFWQDSINVRGLWRRAPLQGYLSDAPSWETVLDFDELAARENKNWVFKGANCFRPQQADLTLCLVSLSDGGKDAVIQREFDLNTLEFVGDGFVTPEAKQGIEWIDDDTLLLATDWDQDGTTLTESGYPSSVRLWRRGEPLSAARELWVGDKTDVGVWPWATELDDGQMIYGAVESDTFFTRQYIVLSGAAPTKYPLPMKAELGDLFEGFQFVTLEQDWVYGDQEFMSGDLLAFDLAGFLKTGDLDEIALVFRANDRQAVNGVAVSRGAALLSISDNVVSRILRLHRDASGWTTQEIDLPDTGQAIVQFSNRREDTVFINYEGFLTPDSLLSYDADTNGLRSVTSLPAKFDTEGLTVSQREANSLDGTQVPYFLVHRKDIQLTRSTPTLLYGYGGFGISMNASYSPVSGRLWLSQGGAYALANIRGGGEFGPRWHQAGLKQNRQRIYDDFIAVAEDLITRKITSSEHLGIMGGSNGGLLMGVMLTQRPELWNAVVIQVPLLDMLRYHKLLAGASWIDEYGDPDIAEERAFLETISPYQNFDEDADYPKPLIVTSTKDDRVHPGHARKMAQKFQAAEKPFLYYENIDGGHSAAANQQEAAKRVALEYVYLRQQLFPIEREMKK